MQVIARLLTVAALSCAAACGLAQEPPVPNPSQPVDYVAWLNKTFGGDIKDNAADRYQSAIEVYVDDEKAYEIVAGGFDWNDEQTQTVRAWVEKNEECLKRFTRASRTEECYFAAKVESGLTGAFVPQLKPLRDIARAASARARLRLGAGDHFAALGDIHALLRCASHLAAHPSVIQYLMGLALRALAEELLLLTPTLPDAPNPQMVLSRLQRVDGSYPKPLFLLGEHALALGYAQGCLRDQDGDGRFDRMVIPPNEAMPEGLDMPHNPPMTAQELAKNVREAFDAWHDVWTDDYDKARVRACPTPASNTEWATTRCAAASTTGCAATGSAYLTCPA